MKKLLYLVFLLINYISFSQNYTFTADLRAEHYQYNDKVKQTDWEPCEATIIITEKECVISDINGDSTYKIISNKLNDNEGLALIIKVTHEGETYDLKLISSGDNEFHFLVTNYSLSTLYRLTNVSKH